MKRLLLAIIATGIAMASVAQTDTTGTGPAADTIKIGGMIIVKKPGDKDTSDSEDITISNRRQKKERSNFSTNWFIVDLGFANYNDNSNYAGAYSQGFVGEGVGKDQMKLRTGKSVNVNIWLFMQRVNLIKHVVNLKYGLGVELNNYRFDDERVRFQKNPTRITLDENLKDIRKNKLAADYATVPVLLNFNFTPGRDKGFGFSGGISAGYLYSARQKTKIGNDRDKLHDDFDLNKWKISYIGELNLGPIRLYGSYARENMWDKGLDMTPYTVGIRLSNF